MVGSIYNATAKLLSKRVNFQELPKTYNEKYLFNENI